MTELRAHAKLTMSLRMTGLRADGFHLIDAEMVSLALHDVLTVRSVEAVETDGAHGRSHDDDHGRLSATGPFAQGVPLDATNLVARAMRRVGRRGDVVIDKHIPHGGGLGGGSTDAAAVLRWGGHGTSPADLLEASTLGADVPFCMIGGRARVRGIGEVVEPLPFLEREITLIVPPLAVSTPAAYRAWDDLGGPTGDGPNDLEAAALVVEPGLRRWRDAITEALGEPPVLAGSGATWFAEGRRDDALGDVVGEGARVLVTRTVPSPFA